MSFSGVFSGFRKGTLALSGLIRDHKVAEKRIGESLSRFSKSIRGGRKGIGPKLGFLFLLLSEH